MLSATWKLEMTHRSICLPLFPARRRLSDIPGATGKDGRKAVVLAGFQLGQELSGGLWTSVSPSINVSRFIS